MNSFFLILLIVIGYFAVLSVIITKLDNRGGVTMAAVVSLLIYGCAIGLLTAMGRYADNIGLLLYAVFIVYSFFFWPWKVYSMVRRKQQIRFGELLVLCAYIIAVLYTTIFIRDGGSNSTIQMEVMNWMQEDGIEEFDHILLNVAMFVPIGVLFPLAMGQERSEIVSAVSFGMLFSILIETGQLLTRSGTCDIDDLITNSIGALIGAFFVRVFRAKKNVKNNSVRKEIR